MMKLQLCFLFFIINTLIINAQISIMPLYIDEHWTYCDYEKPDYKSIYFKKNSTVDGSTWGVFLKLVPLTSKISLYTGLYHGSTSWGYKLFNPSNGVEDRSGAGAFIYNFPVFVNIFDTKISFRKKNNDNLPTKWSLRFKTYLGASYTYVPYDEEYFNANKLTISVPGISYDEYIHLVNTKGASVMSGYSLYLYNNTKHKETLSFSVFYFQGLVNLLGIDVNYMIENNKYFAKLYSRGTSVDFVLAYTININYKKLFSRKTKS